MGLFDSGVNDAMQEKKTAVNFSTSEQHKELGEARRKRDDLDNKGILEFLDQRNRFNKALSNIETGIRGQKV